MSSNLQQVLSDLNRLSPAEQIQVITHLIEGMKEYIPSEPKESPRRWSDLKGMATTPLMDEDAQAWVSRTRQAGDEHRDSLLRAD